jgi:hypothetical protein
MSEITLDISQFKELLKIALAEVLHGQKEVFADMIFEAMEDVALAKAIEEGTNTETVSKASIYKLISEAS